MKCSDVYYHICEDLDGSLDSPRCRRIKEHIEACPDCMAYLDSLKRTVALYRSVPAPRTPRSVHAQLQKILATLERHSANAAKKPKNKHVTRAAAGSSGTRKRNR